MTELLNKTKYSEIDFELSREILDKFNRGEIGREAKLTVKDIPAINNREILNCSDSEFTLNRERVKAAFTTYNLSPSLLPEANEGTCTFDKETLKEIGIRLYPFYSFGILNGGSATSYADVKKNMSLNKEVYKSLEKLFLEKSSETTGKAKGITPAYINKDGSSGPSFIELKMRALLLEALNYKKLTGNSTENLFPFFQMTSIYNNDEVEKEYKKYGESPYLKDLIKETGIEIHKALTGVQPVITAYTHSSEGHPRDFFTKAHNKENSLLPLPGGHGQCFHVLKEVFKELYARGIRFISLGNVDNIGYSPDPVSLALLALSGKQAGFDFSFKTEVDVKGGVLIIDNNDHLNCADLGAAVSREEVEKAEAEGKAILFNCATGLFSLEYLIHNIDTIASRLPVRFSDQDKDAGKYSQAEQITWEVIGILDDLLIFGVDKFDRFLAAKLLLENFMTSGINLNEYKASNPIAIKLYEGLRNKLKNTFALEEINGRWMPV